MAISLEVFVSQSDDSKSIFITEETGVYVAVSNAGGWGAPNPTIGSSLTATVTIAIRNANGTFTNSPNSPITAYPTLPNTTEVEFEITAEDAGYGVDAQFTDNVYKITYLVTGNNGTAYSTSKTVNKALIGQIECCYKELSATYSACNCNCDGIEKRFRHLALQMRLLEAAIESENPARIVKYIDYITSLCEDCGCGC